jgi:glycosyltransferase involved in cell wall biosynthesis
MRVAISMVRDEEDIIEHTLSLMLSQVDHAIIADNMSQDGTRAILESMGDRVTIINDDDPAYVQDVKMTRLAHMAGAMGADWVIPFDADEAWTLPELELVDADVIASRPYVYVPHPASMLSKNPNPIHTTQWRLREPEKFTKVCFRYDPSVKLHMGNHDVDHPGVRLLNLTKIRHYQYRTLEQVRRKVSNGVGAFDASSLPTMYGAHWRELNAYDDDSLRAWWDAYTSQKLVFDPWFE